MAATRTEGVAAMPVTPVSTAIVSDLYWVPVAEVDAHRVRDYFTVKAKVADYTGRGGSTEQPIPIYREDAHMRPGLIGLPIAEGELLFPADTLIEDLSDGTSFDQWTRLPDPNHPSAAPGQQEFMDLAYEATQDYYTNLFKAETGTGKTVVSLGLSARLRLSTLVLVPSVQLMRQWVQQAQDILGLERKHIGLVQGEKCQHHKPFVVGMMKSNAQRQYPPEFYRAFGTLIVDELHNTGATTISRTQGLFNARYKFGLTATDKRRDGADRVYHSYYGKPAFERSMPGVPTDVFVVPWQGPRVLGTRRDQMLAGLAASHERNAFFAKLGAKWYDQGHEALLVTEYVDHAFHLRRYLLAMGIPTEHVGMFTGEQPTDWDQPKSPRVKTKQDYLDWCKAEPPVFIATYGMFKEGVDVPRLNRGMDCLPRADMEQVLGRIRRRMEGKEEYAAWVSLRDRSTPKLDGMHHARMRSINHLASVTIRKSTVEEVLSEGGPC